MKRSHKKTALITGATGQLGWAVANFLHDQGWRLLLLARNGQAMQLAFGHLSDVVLLDVDLTQREALIARVQAALGQEAHLDAVCHLAGGFHMGDGVDALSLPTWEYLLNLNTTSFLNLAAAVVPTLKQQGAGHVVTVGAAAAARGQAHMGAYCAAKSALQRLTEALSAELKMHGINVNCVLPTMLDTPDNRAAMPDANPATWVQPKDLAEVIGFLISGGARAIHGAAIPVAGRV